MIKVNSKFETSMMIEKKLTFSKQKKVFINFIISFRSLLPIELLNTKMQSIQIDWVFGSSIMDFYHNKWPLITIVYTFILTFIQNSITSTTFVLYVSYQIAKLYFEKIYTSLKWFYIIKTHNYYVYHYNSTSTIQIKFRQLKFRKIFKSWILSFHSNVS